MTSVGSGHRDLTTGLQSPHARGPWQATACPGGVRGAWGAGPAMNSRPVSPGSSQCLLPGPACVFLTVALVASSVTWGLTTGSRGGGLLCRHSQTTGSGVGCRRSDDREPGLRGWAMQTFRRQGAGVGGVCLADVHRCEVHSSVLLSGCPLGHGRVRWASTPSAVCGNAFPESNPLPVVGCAVSAPRQPSTFCPISGGLCLPARHRAGLCGAPGSLPGLRVPGSSLAPGGGATWWPGSALEAPAAGEAPSLLQEFQEIQ